MKKVIALLITVCFVVFLSAKEIGGIDIEKVKNYDNHKLVLNGAGIRSKFFFDLYVGSLYLTQYCIQGEKVANEDKPMAITLHIISSMITSKKMKNAIVEGFEKSTDGNFDSLKSNIDKFISFFSKKIQKGDIFEIVYLPNVGTKVIKNQKLVGIIKGLSFKQALFKIWIGKKPAQESLKKAMLTP